MKSQLKKSIDKVVRGMAYWIAYKNEISAVKFTEAEAVGEMANMLRFTLPNSVKVDREVAYKSICSSIKDSRRADLGVFIGDECQCVIEVKLSENTNGGFQRDIKKLDDLKANASDIDCYVILLYRNSCGINEPNSFVSEDGKALKKTMSVGQSKIRVRRVSNALCSPTANKMKKVVCFEVL